jgi:hypothetical protein
MRCLTTIITLTIILVSCKDRKTQDHAPSYEITRTSVYAKSINSEFQYKDILEDYIDSIKPKEIKGLFGKWTITSIAKVSGTFNDENLIQSQIGHHLYLDKQSVLFDFLQDTIKVDNPKYSIEYLNEENGDNMKGTSLFNGYRTCRKSVMMLKVSESLYFEVIHFQEMTYYYDGRIYFLTRLD